MRLVGGVDQRQGRFEVITATDGEPCVIVDSLIVHEKHKFATYLDTDASDGILDNAMVPVVGRFRWTTFVAVERKRALTIISTPRLEQSQLRGGYTGGVKGAIPLRRLLAKNRDARLIKSRFYQSQNAPKLAFLSSKSKKIQLPPHTSLPGGEEDSPSLYSTPRRLDRRAYGARLDSRATSAPGDSIRPN